MPTLTLLRSKVLAWRDAPEPALTSSTDAIVRPFVAARCDGDAAFLRHDSAGLLGVAARMHIVDDSFRRPSTNVFSAPFAYGHEGVAEVTACGNGVRSFAVGDIVIVPWSISCGACAPCAAGLTSKCAPARGDKPLAAFGFSEALGSHGGMVSDALRVPWADAMLVRVPAGVDPVAVASASDNIPDAYRAVGPLLAQQPGAPVLIVGGAAKSIGLYAVGIAKALGSSRVDYLDTSKSRLDLAARLGGNPIPGIAITQFGATRSERSDVSLGVLVSGKATEMTLPWWRLTRERARPLPPRKRERDQVALKRNMQQPAEAE